MECRHGLSYVVVSRFFISFRLIGAGKRPDEIQRLFFRVLSEWCRMVHRRMDNGKPYTYKNAGRTILLYVREEKHNLTLSQSPDVNAMVD